MLFATDGALTWRSPTVGKRQDVVASFGWLGCDSARSLLPRDHVEGLPHWWFVLWAGELRHALWHLYSFSGEFTRSGR